MMESYIPIFVLLGIALLLALLLISLSRLLGPFRPNTNKLNPYESGMDPIGQAKDRYSIGFYLVAMEFIVFDLEVVFVYPWAVQLTQLGTGAFVSMMVFITILLIGLLYTVRIGTLDFAMKPSLANR
ncbi:MAG: NADH-quinone oxidoreductase subunit A [Balneolaceae bacterium]